MRASKSRPRIMGSRLYAAVEVQPNGINSSQPTLSYATAAFGFMASILLKMTTTKIEQQEKWARRGSIKVKRGP